MTNTREKIKADKRAEIKHLKDQIEISLEVHDTKKAFALYNQLYMVQSAPVPIFRDGGEAIGCNLSMGEIRTADPDYIDRRESPERVISILDKLPLESLSKLISKIWENKDSLSDNLDNKNVSN